MTLRHQLAAIVVVFYGAASLLAHPGSGLAVDRRGRVFFADTGGGVWRIDADRRLTRVNDSRFHWLALDPDGRFANGRTPTSSFGDFVRASTDPPIVSSSDFPIAFGGDGALYYSERGRADRRVQLVRWTAAGDRSVFAVLPATTERGPLEWINGLTAGPGGSLYYTENTAIRRVSARGEISTAAVNVTVTGCVEIPGNEPDTGVFLRGLAVTTDGTTLYRFDRSSKQFTSFRPDAGDPAGSKRARMRTVAVDRGGDIWVGGVGYLGRLDRGTGRFEQYFADPAQPSGLPNSEVQSIYTDRRGTLWLATAAGLARFDRATATCTLFTEAEGLPSNLVNNIMEDRAGNLWMRTARGISCIVLVPWPGTLNPSKSISV